MLTESQKKTVEDSLWIVNAVLKRQGIADDDIRQSANVYLCRCIVRYDESKGVKWTTFAYKNVYLYIKRAYAKEKERCQPLVCIDNIPLKREIEPITNDKSSLVQLALKQLLPFERRVLSLKTQGYTHSDIRQLLKCSTSSVNKAVKTIKTIFIAFIGEKYE